MKKPILMLLAITCLMACSEESTNSYSPGAEENQVNYNLSRYSNDVSLFAGTWNHDKDFIMNSDNLIEEIEINSVVYNKNIEIIRDANNNIINTKEYSAGNLILENTVSYNSSGQIAQVTQEDFQSSQNFDYIFTYNGNQVIKSDSYSNYTTVYTFNDNNQLISAEEFVGDEAFKLEELEYDAQGNLISTTLSGDPLSIIAQETHFIYDSSINPLVKPFHIHDYYDIFINPPAEQLGVYIATYGSPNNWIEANGDHINYDIEVVFDSSNRIISRFGTISSADVSGLELEESFNYVD
ncbi:RHS repeat domain-containing protein [Winogradskyella tangerina]|uniref:RHS repeat domain-containing protein n=1 Tax=Winogradskyella tangerina TaxID=2023240 RepID=UPI000DBE3BBA|nr:hypothetical protein [Winogradskyella tangerina]